METVRTIEYEDINKGFDVIYDQEPYHIPVKLQIMNFVLTNDRDFILAVTGKGEIVLIKISTKTIEKKVVIPNLHIDGLDLDEKNEFFYVSGSETLIWKFRFSDFKEVGTLKGNYDLSYRVRISKDQNWLYSISADSTVRAWDLKNFGQSKILYTHSGICNSLDLSFDGEYLITCGHDAKIKIYCISKETLVAKILQSNGLSWCVKFSKNRSYIGSGGDDGNLYIWKFNDWANKKTFSGHFRTIPYFNFTDDEQYCVTSGHDNTIKIWDIESAVLRITLTGHKTSITKLLITEDKKIISGGNDGNIFVWPFPLVKDWTKWIFSYKNSVFCVGNGGINEFDLLNKTHVRGVKFFFDCVETKIRKNWFFSSSKNNVYKWDLESLTNEIFFTAKTVVTSLVSIQNWIVVSEVSRNVTVIDESGSEVLSFVYKDVTKVLCGSDDGKLSCLLGKNGVYLYDLSKNPEKCLIEGNFKFVKFSKNHLNLVSDDNFLTVFSIENDCIACKVKLSQDSVLEICFLKKKPWFVLFFSSYYEVWDAEAYSKISSGSLPISSSSFFVTENEQFIIQDNKSFFITEIRIN